MLPVLHIASAQNDSMEFIQSKNLKIVYLLTLRVMQLSSINLANTVQDIISPASYLQTP